jgi:hypothetical protein
MLVLILLFTDTMQCRYPNAGAGERRSDEH